MTPDDHDVGSSGEDLPVKFSLRTPVDALAAVPYLLGFHPDHSLVALAVGGHHDTCAIRVDLPTDPAVQAQTTTQLTCAIAQLHPQHLLLFAYGPEPPATALLADLITHLNFQGLGPDLALRVTDGRYWSYPPGDGSDCCPPEGRAFAIDTSPVAAEATLAGAFVHPSRAALAATLDVVQGEARSVMLAETARAERDLHPPATAADPPADARTLRSRAVRLIEDLYGRAATDGAPPTAAETAELGVMLTDLRIRDEAWVRMDPDHLRRYLPLWTHLVQHLEPRYRAAPATLLAYTAYVSGDGALANLALERAEQADPSYPMTELLRAVIAAGVPPAVARMRLSPEQLDQLWELALSASGPDAPHR